MSNVVAEASPNLIPVGYKQTEVGVIPADWNAVRLGDISEVRMCKRILAGQTQKIGAIPFFKIGTFGSEPDAYISRFLYKEFRAKYSFPNKGDILISAAGTLGKSVVYDGKPAYFQDSNIVWLEVNKCKLLNEYLYHYYNIIKWESSEGSTIARLYNGIIRASMIALPKISEQTAIANALSDVDALISELEKLIAKKQAIKTATMQQLLTGRTRLPQFALREDGSKKGTKQSELGEIPEDWDIFCFSDCGYFQSGSGFPTKYQGEQEGDYPFFKVSDMNNIGNQNILRNSNNYISESIRNLIAAKIIPVNAIIFAKIGAAIFLERKKICFQPSCIDNNLMSYIVNNDKLYYKYAYLLFKNINLGHLVEATALPSLSSRDIGQKKVAVPTMEEQTAIATILSDMDEEIQALEQRLSKTRQIKLGMMQELLTGRTRLV